MKKNTVCWIALGFLAGIGSAQAHPTMNTTQTTSTQKSVSPNPDDPAHMQFITTDKPMSIKQMKIQGAAVAHNQQENMMTLQIACQEYLSIYQKDGKEKFLSFLTASQADTYRAGYCLGSIKNYFPTNFQCKPASNYDAAQFLVKNNINNYYSVNQFLTAAVCQNNA